MANDESPAGAAKNQAPPADAAPHAETPAEPAGARSRNAPAAPRKPRSRNKAATVPSNEVSPATVAPEKESSNPTTVSARGARSRSTRGSARTQAPSAKGPGRSEQPLEKSDATEISDIGMIPAAPEPSRVPTRSRGRRPTTRIQPAPADAGPAAETPPIAPELPPQHVQKPRRGRPAKLKSAIAVGKSAEPKPLQTPLPTAAVPETSPRRRGRPRRRPVDEPVTAPVVLPIPDVAVERLLRSRPKKGSAAAWGAEGDERRIPNRTKAAELSSGGVCPSSKLTDR